MEAKAKNTAIFVSKWQIYRAGYNDGTDD